MPTASSFWPERLLRKVRTLWHCSRLRSVASLTAIDRGDIRQAIDRCSNIWASLSSCCGQLSIRLDSLIANSKKRAERSERLMYEQSHRDYLRSGYLHHRLACHGLLIITVITPLPTKPSATKMPGRN